MANCTHPRTPENTYTYPDGEQACRSCRAESRKNYTTGPRLHPLDWSHEAIQRFWSKVTTSKDGCWEFLGSQQNKKGYKSFSHKYKHYIAHRISYMLLAGDIPETLVPDHLCRNPGCVNPDHLEPVTTLENIRRGSVPKLSIDQVREIKSSTLPTKVLVQSYGVAQTTIDRIRKGTRWAGVALTPPERNV